MFLTKTIGPTISLFIHLEKSMWRHGGQKQEKYRQNTLPLGEDTISNLVQMTFSIYTILNKLKYLLMLINIPLPVTARTTSSY